MYESDEEDSSAPGSAATLELGQLQQIFRAQLLACLEECSRGRRGLFASLDHLKLEQLGDAAPQQPWPEAEQLRQLAFALQSLHAQQYEEDGQQAASALIEQFLDLCSIHGEADPGEPRLARAFLQQIAGEKPC